MRSLSRRSVDLASIRTKIRKNKPIVINSGDFSQIVDEVLDELRDRINFKLEVKMRQVIVSLVKDIVEERDFNIPGLSLNDLVERIVDSILGYDKLHHLVVNRNITDIVVINHRHTMVREGLRWRPVSVDFGSPEKLEQYIRQITSRLGGKFNVANPDVPVEDPEYNLRIRAVGYDISPDSPQLTIRSLRKEPLTKEQLRYSMSETIEEFLRFCIKAELNIGITGNYGSGKTSMLSTLLSWIPKNKMPGLIQSSNEIPQVHPNLRRRLTRNSENIGENARSISEMDLLEFAKQESFDILALGEFLNGAAHTMLHIMQQGVMALYTYHGGSAKEAYDSFNYMVQMNERNMYSEESLKQKIAQYNDIVLVMDRLRVRELVQFTGELKDGEPVYETLFRFNVRNETNYELNGDWEKVAGVSLCEKLLKKAALKGASVPTAFRERGIKVG
jgi:Flp pilus assembly CpaF family ATPase